MVSAKKTQSLTVIILTIFTTYFIAICLGWLIYHFLYPPPPKQMRFPCYYLVGIIIIIFFKDKRSLFLALEKQSGIVVDRDSSLDFAISHSLGA